MPGTLEVQYMALAPAPARSNVKGASYGSAIRRSVSLMILFGKAMVNRLINTRVDCVWSL
jgi:hypothetical protein